jgi:hypothetical protein
MKTFATCMQCQVDLGRPSFEPFTADYFDDGIAFIECSAGHKTALRGSGSNGTESSIETGDRAERRGS